MMTFHVFHGLINQVPPLQSVFHEVKILRHVIITVPRISANQLLHCVPCLPLPSVSPNIK
jgi:hypothetical protein